MARRMKWNALASSRELILWGLVLLFILFFGVKRLIRPTLEKMQTAQAVLSAKKVEYTTFQKFAKDNQAKSQQATPVDQHKKAIARRVKDHFETSNITSDVVVSELLSYLTKPEYAKDAMVEKFNFTGENKQIGFSEMQFELKLIGSYDGIAGYLRILKSVPYLVKVDSIMMRPAEKSAPGKIELVAKSVLYVGDASTKMPLPLTLSRTDLATDLLSDQIEIRRRKMPFSAKPREMTGWSVQGLKLTATMAGSTRPSALINGQIFQLGDEIADYKLVEVRMREVLLKRGEAEFILKINDPNMPVETEEEEAESPRPPESAPSKPKESSVLAKPEAVKEEVVAEESKEALAEPEGTDPNAPQSEPKMERTLDQDPDRAADAQVPAEPQEAVQ